MSGTIKTTSKLRPKRDLFRMVRPLNREKKKATKEKKAEKEERKTPEK